MPQKEICPSDVDELAHALAGAGGGALSMALTYPLVTITTKLQTQGNDENNQVKSKLETIKEIYRKDGLLGFYAGLESAIYGMALTNFVYYYFYELTSRNVLKVRKHKKLNTLESMLTGCVAGSVTAIASNPIWVANTRMTVTKSEKTALATIIEIVKKDSAKTLFNGLKPALVLVMNPIVQYTVFEQLKNLVLAWNKQGILSPSWAFLLGALGKLAATGSTYPYITLKTRMHLSESGKHTDDDSGKKAKGHKASSKSMLSLITEIVKKDGVSGLYRGVGIKLAQSILTAAFLFFFKEGLVLWSIKVLKLFRQINQRRLKPVIA